MSLGLNWWAWESHAPPIGWFLVDFVIFVGGLWLIAGGPLRRAFRQRHARIKRAIGEAAAAHARATARHTEARARLSQSEAEARALLQASEVDGAAERDQIIAAARAHGAQLEADCGQQAVHELHRARGRLRRALLRRALARAAALLAEQLQPEDQQRLLEAAIVELEGGRELVVRRPRAPRRPAGSPP